jgi:hypothetical protein
LNTQGGTLHHPRRLSSFCCEPQRSWSGLWQQERLQLSRPADQKKIKYSTEKIVHKILIGRRHRNVTVEWAMMF